MRAAQQVLQEPAYFQQFENYICWDCYLCGEQLNSVALRKSIKAATYKNSKPRNSCSRAWLIHFTLLSCLFFVGSLLLAHCALNFELTQHRRVEIWRGKELCKRWHLWISWKCGFHKWLTAAQSVCTRQQQQQQKAAGSGSNLSTYVECYHTNILCSRRAASLTVYDTETYGHKKSAETCLLKAENYCDPLWWDAFFTVKRSKYLFFITHFFIIL